jgi:hypothetical protein
MNKLISAICILVLCISCGGGGGSTAPSPSPSPSPSPNPSNMATQYLPLTISNKWQYAVDYKENNGSTTKEHTYRVSQENTTFNNVSSYRVKNDILEPDKENENFFYANEDDGIHWIGFAADYTAGNGYAQKVTFDTAPLLLKSTFNLNDTWSTSTHVNYYNNGTLQDAGTITYTVTVKAIEDVTVPAGTFSNCYKIEIVTTNNSSLLSNETNNIWIADGIGVVKEDSVSDDGNSYQNELSYASVDGTEYGTAVPVILSKVDDDFNDGVLSPSWRIDLEDATDWTYTESGTTLTVSGVTPLATNPGVAVLQEYVDPYQNFTLSFKFSWDSGGDNAAVQSVHLQLHTIDDQLITWVAYRDIWNGQSGEQFVQIGNNNFYETGPDSLPLSGNATVTVARVGSNISIAWDGNTILTGTDDRAVEVVELSFNHESAGIGSISVDSVKLQ